MKNWTKSRMRTCPYYYYVYMFSYIFSNKLENNNKAGATELINISITSHQLKPRRQRVQYLVLLLLSQVKPFVSHLKGNKYTLTAYSVKLPIKLYNNLFFYLITIISLIYKIA